MTAPDPAARWAGQFGRDYTSRNPATADDLDTLYQTRYGVTRSEMNAAMITDVPRSAAILEIGCNRGAQLHCLSGAGYSNLAGIDINSQAIALAGGILPKANLRIAKATAVPFQPASFDMVFTSGVLIHIPPLQIGTVIDEMARLSRRWIWGFEYAGANANDPISPRRYRGQDGLMWTGDYAEAISARHPEFRIVSRAYYRESESAPWDQMYLLERK